MPKTYTGLYDGIISLESLYHAHKEVIRGKIGNDVASYSKDHIEEIIDKLRNDLLNLTWQPDPYRRFVTKKEVKRRNIDEPSYRDRILHHAIVEGVRKCFEPKFIYDSYAVTPGKGQHRAVKRAQKFMREVVKEHGKAYILQCDVHHYYESMRHGILFDEIQRTIRDKRLLTIWERIIEGYQSGPDMGLPIGAVTSQLSANIYLNPFDHFIKECVGWKRYLRYMDDFLLIGPDKRELWLIYDDIKWFLDTQLRLHPNRRTRLAPNVRGIDFCGYRIFSGHILPRKRNVKAARLRFRKFSKLYSLGKATLQDAMTRAQSFLGYMTHCDGAQTTASTLRYLVLRKGIE